MIGIINVCKPPHMTSHDVVSLLRKKLGIKKIGHTGTLDPMAVGVLPICIGKATKIVDYIQNERKLYRAELTLGIRTDTQDKWGEIIDKRNVDVSQIEIENTIKSFVGEIEQIPPMYSAVKLKGKKLYELAREGLAVEREPRKIEIYSIKIIKLFNNKVLFDVECSRGTYIRTLCHDIGEKLGCGAHMSFLVRLKSGNFSINDSITIEELLTSSKDYISKNFLLNIDYPLSDYPKVYPLPNQLKSILNGRDIDINDIVTYDKLDIGNKVLIYINNKFIAIGEYHGEFIKIKKVFS